jgi:hypothetical protein
VGVDDDLRHAVDQELGGEPLAVVVRRVDGVQGAAADQAVVDERREGGGRGREVAGLALIVELPLDRRRLDAAHDLVQLA